MVHFFVLLGFVTREPAQSWLPDVVDAKEVNEDVGQCYFDSKLPGVICVFNKDHEEWEYQEY